ncbi:MAG: hypothetical protein M1368_00580 [Thaumarchaeota archaeon]|nr:hypothetical protein [Nitrososphaerota archaeon]
MKLYEWCKECMAPPEPVKVLAGDEKEEATLYLSKDSLLWKTNVMGGISLSSVKMVEAEDEKTLSIGYSSGARIESVRIQLLDTEQFEWNKPLLKWYLHLVQGDVLTTSAMKVYQQYYLAFKREFEKMFDIAYNQNKSIREIKSVEGGDSFWHKPVHMLNQLLEKEYPVLLKYHPKDETYGQSPQRIHLPDFPKLPYETQMNCAKLYYLIFLAKMASAKQSLIEKDQDTLYSDSQGMTPDDYEKLFMHYGLIEKPFLSEDFKATLVSRSDTDYLEDANGPRPKDYKQWFLKSPAPLVSQ